MNAVKLKYSSPQPIWESSQRLLHPKCIWIESFGGHRHFIFDRHISQESHSPTDSASSDSKVSQQPFGNERSKSFNHIQSKQTYLSVIGSGDLMANTENRRIPRARSNKVDPTINTVDDIVLIAPNELNSTQSTSSSNTNIRQISNEIDLCKNLLADRVLQWLDLAENRTVSVKRNNSIELGLSAIKRRSLMTKESTKSNEQVRRESIHHLSMTFNDNDAHDDATGQAVVALRFDQFFPTTYRCSRKFLSLRRTSQVPDMPNTAIPIVEPNGRRPSDTTSKQKQPKSGKFNSKSKRLTAYFDDQYRSMIQRQILETSCNTQLAKRQLHIFMPNLPKKLDHSASPLSPAIQSATDTDSCLGSHISK